MATMYPTKRQGRFVRLSATQANIVRLEVLEVEDGKGVDSADYSTTLLALDQNDAAKLANEILSMVGRSERSEFYIGALDEGRGAIDTRTVFDTQRGG